MKKLLIKLLILTVLSGSLICGYCVLAARAAKKYIGINTADQVKMSFENSVKDSYNCYFLGNSRLYRNINPDKFPSVHAYNFAHDNDSYNQMYYKLLYLLEHGERIDYLFAGTDYFQFSYLSDSRNYIYSKYFPAEYLADFEDGNNWFSLQKEYLKTLWGNKQNCLSACIKYVLRRPVPKNLLVQKPNGQFVVYGAAKGDEKADRDYQVLDVQYVYYKKIIELCQANDIELYVIMPPLRKGEIESHTDEERAAFNKMIRDSLAQTPYAEHYYNYSESEGLSPYTDFTDIVHLTPEASDRYSAHLNNLVFGKS